MDPELDTLNSTHENNKNHKTHCQKTIKTIISSLTLVTLALLSISMVVLYLQDLEFIDEMESNLKPTDDYTQSCDFCCQTDHHCETFCDINEEDCLKATCIYETCLCQDLPNGKMNDTVLIQYSSATKSCNIYKE